MAFWLRIDEPENVWKETVFFHSYFVFLCLNFFVFVFGAEKRIGDILSQLENLTCAHLYLYSWGAKEGV